MLFTPNLPHLDTICGTMLASFGSKGYWRAAMLSLVTFTTPVHACSYLPDRQAKLQYEIVADISAEEYQERLAQGWRHFGHSLFRPQCRPCRACQSLRIVVDRFQPNRSQKRAWEANRDVVLTIDVPAVTEEKLDLYDRYHEFQADFKNWPEHGSKEESGYRESFVDNPVPTQEWRYTLGDKLIGVGYVDRLPAALSAIYFFYDPEERHRSLGTFNVLNIIAEAARLQIPHVYMGYFVAGCRSLEYKANFLPNEVMSPNGQWIDFRTL